MYMPQQDEIKVIPMRPLSLWNRVWFGDEESNEEDSIMPVR